MADDTSSADTPPTDATEAGASDEKRGVTASASRVVHGVADAGTGAVEKIRDAAKDALPDAVPDVADKLVDAAARFATAKIDHDARVVDGALSVARRAGTPIRIAAVIATVAIIAVLIARRA